MKNRTTRIVCMVFLTMFICIPVAAANETPVTVTIVYAVSSNPPFIMGKGTGIDLKKPGTTIEMLMMVAQHLDIQIKFKRIPWKRGLMFLENNEADGIFHASFKEKRTQIGVYPTKDGKADPAKRILDMSYTLYKLKDSPLTWDGSAFENLNGPIAATIGYAVIDTLKKKGVTVDEGKRTSHSMMKLLKGRVAAVAELETMADAFLALNPEKFKNVAKMKKTVQNKPYYLLLSHRFVKEHPKLSRKIWDEIETVRESAAFKKRFFEYAR
ncbi:transporter substrate-binding domain-containing protein [Desulfobacterales bacterium HSG16]|nr:transporter substrate-binding domain-containing protein [Desulfobacterales bacterium HSG16]